MVSFFSLSHAHDKTKNMFFLFLYELIFQSHNASYLTLASQTNQVTKNPIFICNR